MGSWPTGIFVAGISPTRRFSTNTPSLESLSPAALTAFGERLDNEDDSSSAIRSLGEGWFTGKPHVAGLGHAFLFRNYRAGLAKWQTADPMAYIDGWNRLTYCGNEVAIAVDLWGCHTVKVGEVVFDMRVMLPDDFTRAEELHLADVWLECNHNYDNPHATLDAYTKSGLFYATIYVKDDITYTFKYSLTPESRVTGYTEVDYETKAVEYQWAVKIVITAKKKITTEGGGVVTSEAHFTYSTELTNGKHLIRRTHE